MLKYLRGYLINSREEKCDLYYFTYYLKTIKRMCDFSANYTCTYIDILIDVN